MSVNASPLELWWVRLVSFLAGFVSAQRREKNRFERVEPVFSLVIDPGSRMIHHVVGHFFAPVGRQAVQENGVVFGGVEEIEVHSVWIEGGPALIGLGFLTHRSPDIGVDRIGSGHRLLRVVGDHHFSEAMGFGQQPAIRLVAGGVAILIEAPAIAAASINELQVLFPSPT